MFNFQSSVALAPVSGTGLEGVGGGHAGDGGGSDLSSQPVSGVHYGSYDRPINTGSSAQPSVNSEEDLIAYGGGAIQIQVSGIMRIDGQYEIVTEFVELTYA